MSKTNIKINLCRPDKTTIYTITNILDPTYTQSYGGINTLNFRIPYYISESMTGNLIKNPVISLIKQYYLLFFNNEYFIIDFPNQVSNDTSDFLEIKSYSLGFQLSYKKIRSYQSGISDAPIEEENPVLTSESLQTVSDWILRNTGWTTGTIGSTPDGSLSTKVRTVEIADSTILEAINTICGIWGCIPKFDTINKTISYYDYNYDGGIFQGLVFTKTRYLQDLECDKVNDIVTKLYVFGVNDVSINAVSPSGLNYITDYSYFKNLDYMTQNMIDQLTVIETVISDSLITFNDLLNQRNVAYTNLLSLGEELFSLLNENDIDDSNDATTYTDGLNVIDIKINEIKVNPSIANSPYYTALGGLTWLNGQRSIRQGQVDAKQAEIDATQIILDGLDAQIQGLRDTFTLTGLSEIELQLLNDLTFEGTYVDSVITSAGETQDIILDLYNEGKKQLQLLSIPRFSASVDIVDFYNCEDTNYDKDKLRIGDIVKIIIPEMNINLNAKIIEIEQGFDDNKLNIKIANEKDLLSGFTTAESLIKNVSGINGIISTNANDWSNGGEARTIIDDYISGAIDATTQTINAGKDNTVQINENGITIIDPHNPQYIQRFTAGAWGLSSDGGTTYITGASEGVIHADVIAGNLIIGQNGLFEGLQIYDQSTNEVLCTIGDFTSLYPGTEGDPKRGIQIVNGAFELVGGSMGGNDENAIHFDENYNSIAITSVNGIEITDTNNKIRLALSATNGICLETSTDGITWIPAITLDPLGNAYFKGSGEFAGTVNALDLQIDGTSILTTINGQQKINGQFISGDIGVIKEIITNNLSSSKKIYNHENNIQTDLDYISIHEENIDFIYAQFDSTEEQQATNSQGDLLYWVDDTHLTGVTLENTGLPVLIYTYTDIVEASICFQDETYIINGEEVIKKAPKFILGSANELGYGKGRLYKSQIGLELDYYENYYGRPRKLKLDDTGIHGFIQEYQPGANIRNIIITNQTPNVNMGNINDIIFKIS